jgi:hypothetical protein
MTHLKSLEELHITTDGASYALQLHLEGGESLSVALTPGQLNALVAAAERLTGASAWPDLDDREADAWLEGP